jgi:uncharacterized protein YbjT (DUF2867 family)
MAEIWRTPTRGGSGVQVPLPEEAIAVVGASGFLGRMIVDELVGDPDAPDRCVVAIGRRRSALPWGQGIVVRPADVADSEQMTVALAGVGVAFFLAHSLERPDFAAHDLRLARAFAAAAAEAGVRRIIYPGTLGPAGATEHIDARRQVGRMLRTTGVEVVEVRVGMVLGPGSPAMRPVETVVGRLPVLALTPWAQRSVDVIAGGDVAHALLDAVRLPAGTYELAGRQLTYEELLRRYARARGLRRLFVRVPYVLHWFVVAAISALDRANRAHTATVLASTRVDVEAERCRSGGLAAPTEDPVASAVRQLEESPPTSGGVRAGWQLLATGPHEHRPQEVHRVAGDTRWPCVGGRPRRPQRTYRRHDGVVAVVARTRFGVTAAIMAVDPPGRTELWFLPQGMLGRLASLLHRRRAKSLRDGIEGRAS